MGNTFNMRLLGLLLFVLASCGQLDKYTENKVNRILMSANFEFYTYQVNCVYPDRTTLTKDKKGKLTFTTDMDSSFTVTNDFNEDVEQKIRQIIEHGYNIDVPGDTGPGNMNRYYWLYSPDDTLRFVNNDKELYAMFLNIGRQSIKDAPYKNQ